MILDPGMSLSRLLLFLNRGRGLLRIFFSYNTVGKTGGGGRALRITQNYTYMLTQSANI